MLYERVLLEKSNFIATVTMNKPEKLNAMDLVFLHEFKQCLDELVPTSIIYRNVLYYGYELSTYSNRIEARGERCSGILDPVEYHRATPGLPRPDHHHGE